MAEWPDPKIRSTALWYIGRNATGPATWRFTTLGEVPPAVMNRGHLQSGELSARIRPGQQRPGP